MGKRRGMGLWVRVDGRSACRVKLYTDKPRLGPSDAMRAVRIAAGLGSSGYVADEERAYRVTARGARLVREEGTWA